MSAPGQERIEFLAELRGANFRPPAKAIIEALRGGARLSIVRDPTNKYDPNALMVLCAPEAVVEEDRAGLELTLAGYGRTLEEFDEAPEWFLGFVAKEIAKKICAAGEGELSGTLSFSGAGKPMVNVVLELGEPG